MDRSVFERFTPDARRAIVLSQEEARALRHRVIDTGHLLLALLQVPGAVAARALVSLGVTPDGSRRLVAAAHRKSRHTPAGPIPMTEATKKTLEFAVRWQERRADESIDTQHLLLGLMTTGIGSAAQVLSGLDAGRVEAAVNGAMNAGRPEPPGVVLRPMRPDEFEPWAEWANEKYAQDSARSHAIPVERAREVEGDIAGRLLPDGLATESHRLLVAEDAQTGERVGYLWFAEKETEAGPVCWLYDIYVEEPVRGKGYGLALMERLEQEARSLGLSRIELNVDGFNERARKLYASLGYLEMARQLYKELGSQA